MSQVYDQAMSSTGSLAKGASMDDINAWWTDVNKLRRKDPEGFAKWEQDNLEMAVRYHARGANKNVDSGFDDHAQRAKVLGVGIGMRDGMGTDMKENGRMIATDYDSFKDVNNEWGQGDFWKIGTPQTLDKGLGAFLDNMDLKDVMMMAAPFVLGPAIAPALAGMGITGTTATALTNSLMAGLKGGDLENILMSGVTPYVTGGINDLVSGAIGVDTEIGKQLLDKGWNPDEIANQIAKGGMDAIKGKDFQDIILGGLEGYIGKEGIGNLPGPGLPDMGFEMPDWLPEGDGDLFAGAKDLFGDIGDWTEEKWDQFKDVLPEMPNLPGMPNLPNMPDWQGPDWNPNLPNINLPSLPGMPAQGPQIAQGMMAAPREPTELAKLFATPQIKGPTPMGAWLNPQGMFS